MTVLHPESLEAAPRKHRVESAARVVQILQFIAKSADGVSAKAIAEGLSLPKQVVYHLLHTLTAVQATSKASSDRYILGIGLLPMVGAVIRHLSPQEQLLPLVRRISAETGETAYAAGWFDHEIMVVATASGSNPIQAAEIALGNCGYANARASGKLLLALASKQTRDDFLNFNPPVRKTEKSIVTLDDLEAEFEKIRMQGYALDLEEFTEGLCCLAVPLAQSGGVFALGLSAPKDMFRVNRQRYIETVQRIAGVTGY